MLLSVKYNAFVEMTSLENQKIYLASVRKEEEKKESLQCRLAGLKANKASGTNATWYV